LRSPKNNHRQFQNRRRGFDDDNFYGNAPTPMPLPSFASPSSAPEVQATVKWFNADKGFGFAALTDGSGDVFLHINTLQAAGRQTVSPGATLRVRVGAGQKGRQVEQVISVDDSTAEPERRSHQGGPYQGGPHQGGPHQGAPRTRRQVDMSTAVEMSGTVKWYDPAKGFGFITPQDGGRDVFIHATALERAGLGPLQERQAVRMGVVQGAKGPEVGSISLE
jgi:CspA family cold shock protein